MKKILIEEMSWVEFKEAMASTDLVIIPIGVSEEHGYHNPVGTDTFIAEAAAKRIGEKLGVPVAPVMPFGYTANLTKFAGTISLDPELLRKVMVSYAESYVKHGAKRFLFINGHGGNNDPLRLVCNDLYACHGCICFHTEWWENLLQIDKEKWPCDDHGGHFETSMMMVANEDIVNLSKAAEATVNGLTSQIVYSHGWHYNGARIPIPVELYGHQKVGNVGRSPFTANKELGEEMMEAYVEFNVELAKEMLKIEL